MATLIGVDHKFAMKKIINTLPRLSLNRRSILLPLILLLGLFFRLYALGGESLWLDEAISIRNAKLNFLQISFGYFNTPPLYYIFLHWWTSIFGFSEFAVRLPSVIFGVLSLLIIYEVGNLLFDSDTGRLSSMLMAFSVFHIQFSQEARTYSLSVLLTLLSMYYFIKLIKRENYQVVIGYILSSILLMYSHIYGLFVIIAQNIYFIGVFFFSMSGEKLNRTKWIVIQSTLIVLFSPWVGIFISQVRSVQKDFWIPKSDISTVASTFLTYASGFRVLLYLFLVLLAFSFISIENKRIGVKETFPFSSLKNSRWKIRLFSEGEVVFLFIWLITPIVLPFIISQFSQPIYFTKYTIVASSAFILLVARGIRNLASKSVKSIAISIVIALSLISIIGYHAKIKKEQWREVAKYVDTNARSGDVVLFNAPYCMVPFNLYSHGDFTKRGFPESVRPLEENDITTLRQIAEHYGRIWLILSHNKKNKELIVKTLIKYYHLSYSQHFKGIRLYLFEKGETPV